MNYTYIQNFFNFNILYFLFIFQSIKISISSPVDTIINLGLRYSHFSFNSNGDMIVDTHNFPIDNKRLFFGLKKNGEFYFKDSDNKGTPYYLINMAHNTGRIEGESYFIKLSSANPNINGRELLCGISKLTDAELNYYVELYNLESKNYTYFKTNDVFGLIISDVFSVLKLPVDSDSHFNYIVSYIMMESSDNIYLITKKTYFSFDISEGFQHTIEKSIKVSDRRSVTCFFTESFKYICFYQSLLKRLRVIVYDSSFDNNVNSLI